MSSTDEVVEVLGQIRDALKSLHPTKVQKIAYACPRCKVDVFLDSDTAWEIHQANHIFNDILSRLANSPWREY